MLHNGRIDNALFREGTLLWDVRQRWRHAEHIMLRARVQVAYRRWRIRQARKATPEAYTDEDPFAVFTAPAREIRFTQRIRFDKLADAGRIIDGDWDEDVQPFEEDLLYRACQARFKQGAAWQDTPIVQEASARVVAGQVFWHGCRSIDDIHARCQTVDDLYQSMSTRGYRRRAEVNPDAWTAALDEVTVNIGRDGRLIRNSSGWHRLCVARVLEIEEIPVRILVRHRSWKGDRIPA